MAVSACVAGSMHVLVWEGKFLTRYRETILPSVLSLSFVIHFVFLW